MRLSVPIHGASPFDEEDSVIYASTWSSVLLWMKMVFVQDTVPKIGVALLAAWVAGFEAAAGPPLTLALMFWFLDFVLGIVRSIADPEVRLDTAKAAKGALKPLVIVVLALAAFGIEEMINLSIGYHLNGKLVLGVMIGIVWEECVSIQEKGRFFFRRFDAGFELGRRLLGQDKEED